MPPLGVLKVLVSSSDRSGSSDRRGDPDGEVELEISTTRGSWCTNLYFLLGTEEKPHSWSTILPATCGPTQTLQSTIQTISPFASR